MKNRLYIIANQYMAGIHAGIQGAHAMAELFIRYPQTTLESSHLLWDWAVNDKTIIVLNGGYQSNLQGIYDLLEKQQGLPYAKFHEEADALNGALTAVAVVLPERLYGLTRDITGELEDYWFCPETYEMFMPSHPEREIMKVIKSLRLKGE